MPGVIKAVISDFNYKKIFSSKTAAPKRFYSVVIAVDVSYSMNGHTSECMIATLLAFILALRKIEIENFSILTFGQCVRLIKLENQQFDASVIYTLFNNLRFDNDYLTRDSEAIEVAISLLRNGSMTSGTKRIFVFTDGYSSSKKKLIKTLKKADDLDIQVIGVAVGFDQPYVRNVYKMYIHAALPVDFHQALEALYSDTSKDQINFNQFNNDIYTEEDLNFDDINDLLANFDSNRVFTEYLSKLDDELNIQFEQTGHSVSEMSVDVCFCLDSTGSMLPWFDEIKRQILFLADQNKLSKKLKDAFPNVKFFFNFGILAFKDICDKDQFEKEFMSPKNTTDHRNFINFVHNLSCGGGGDIPEDILGALKHVTTDKWESFWKSNIRFIILITDAPDHNLVNNTLQNANLIQNAINQIKLKNIQFFSVKIHPQTTFMESEFLKVYNKSDNFRNDYNMKLIDLSSKMNVVDVSSHFIFLLDESGSMSNQKWNELKMAYNTFLDDKKSMQTCTDVISIITYNDSARVICTAQSVETSPKELNFLSGGTNFLNAFKAVDDNQIILKSNANPIIVFMTDGLADDPSAYLLTLMKKYENRNLKIYAILFGNDLSGKKVLENIAKIGKTENYKTALDGSKLYQTFKEIPNAENQVMDEMVKSFTEIITSEIETTIAVDYL